MATYHSLGLHHSVKSQCVRQRVLQSKMTIVTVGFQENIQTQHTNIQHTNIEHTNIQHTNQT